MEAWIDGATRVLYDRERKEKHSLVLTQNRLFLLEISQYVFSSTILKTICGNGYFFLAKKAFYAFHIR